MGFVPGDLVSVNLRPQERVGLRTGAPIWDEHPWRGPAVIRWRLPEGALAIILEQVRRAAEDPSSGASLILSPTSGITGWVMDEYLDALELAEIPTDVEAV